MKTHNRKHERRAGFSLAELMVVIVIIGLLATLVMKDVVKNLFTASETTAKANITTISQALEQYAIENQGRYPETLQLLIEKDENGFSFLQGDKVPTDPWGNEFGYEPPGSGQTKPRVICYGADGVPGGEGQDKDFDNFMILNKEI